MYTCIHICMYVCAHVHECAQYGMQYNVPGNKYTCMYMCLFALPSDQSFYRPIISYRMGGANCERGSTANELVSYMTLVGMHMPLQLMLLSIKVM